VQLHPTRMTLHVAIAGAGLIGLGAVARLASVVAFGGSMLLAVAIGRALALLAVTALRESGFEMVWLDAARVHRMARGETRVIAGQVRNRSEVAVRCVALRPVASSMLEVRVEPTSFSLSPGGVARVSVAVRASRIGRWGIHGLALEVRGAALGGEGLYEVPLLFASPLGIEVLPKSLAVLAGSPIGGRARRASELGRAAASPGEGDEMRELRNHAPGDPFKRIAWKASARRGRLLVREMERDERDVIWLVVDASVDLWAGKPGSAPLDRVMEDVASRAARLLRRGERVGLVVAAARLRSWIAPEPGPLHGSTIAAALASASSCVDADRSELDETDVAQRVVEHARPLDPQGLGDLANANLDVVAERAELLVARAPFAPRVPFAATPREQTIRRYLTAFGIESPPRIDGERAPAEATLALALARLASEKPRPSSVHVWAPPPSKEETMAKAVAALRARRIRLRWTLPPLEAGIGAERDRRSPVADAVDEAVRLRARAMAARGEGLLRRLGVRIEGLHRSGAGGAAP
jgi:uncharacterized protein (DUF58 family)